MLVVQQNALRIVIIGSNTIYPCSKVARALQFCRRAIATLVAPGTRISVLTEKHGGGGGSCLSGPILMSRTTHELGLLSAPTFTIPHEQGEAEGKQTPFPNQESSSYSTPPMPNNIPKPKSVPKPISNIRSNCHKPDQISEPKNYSHVNSNSNFQPKNQITTLTDMMKLVSAWFEFEENKNSSCDILEDRIITCGENDQEDLVEHFNVVKFENMEDQICPTAHSGPTTSVAEVNVPIGEQLKKMTNEGNIFADLEVKPLIVVVQLVVVVGFESIKTKGSRHCQRRIFLVFTASVLVPLWTWDVLRRDFSVRIYHSYKMN
ncbi:hypothetical protein TIFTF001_007208 [Ficus carica]|uniref:Uncharacterized protein n=1 Tax=Ficus carica TaxID=3494 RepID=A0AA87ZR71_FICCA|nr:hypothetical protein TIFTF001_007208 [Ficus carica]